MRRLIVTLTSSLILFACTTLAPPQARYHPVTDVYHGVAVEDGYHWLEDWKDPEVRAWSEGQNAYARSVLNKLPAVEALTERVTDILNAISSSYNALAWRRGTLFALKFQPPLNQPFLVAMPSADQPEAERVIVDPNRLDPAGATTIDWYVPSPDGQLVAVSLSKGGTESGDVHIFMTATGEERGEVIPRVNSGTAGGDVAWTPDGTGFFYTRSPRPGERESEDLNFYQQVWYHKLGTTTDEDVYEIGEDFPRIAEILLEVDAPTGWVLATVQFGDSGRFTHYLRSPDGMWKQIADYDDQIVQAIFGSDGTIFLLSGQGAPRGKVLTVSLRDPSLANAATIIPEGDAALVSSFYAQQSDQPPVVATATRLYLTYQTGGPSEIRVFDYQGRPQPGPALLPVSSVGQMVPLERDNLLFRHQSFVDPPAWYLFNPGDGSTVKTALATDSPVDYSDTEVVREYAISKDGTRVPVNIYRRKNLQLDGSHPVLLTGYGGYGISITPSFSSTRRIWIEQGGVYAIANLRGGGEFGEEWHRQGMLTRKQNVFDDFAAVMQYLIDAGYTTPARLAIVGGSNGGTLMGAMITQHPDLFKATVSYVGVYDVLRVELSPNGAFNIPEFGTVKDQEQFKALYAYSPYHNLKDCISCPAVLFMTGANDPRVDPMQSRKMIARLQAATSSDAPILLRTSSETGHGGGTPLSEQVKEIVNQYAFLFHQLGMAYRPVTK